MSREQERIRRKPENNPVMECNKIRNMHCHDLFYNFAGIKNPRNLSYTKYPNDELLGTLFFKGIAGIESMQMMTYEFKQERVAEKPIPVHGNKRKRVSPPCSHSQ